jgi:DnaK suppressor protein
MSHELPVRYSDEELEAFRVLIEDKIAKAQEELDFTQRQVDELNENGFNQQGGDWYDDSTAHTDLELLQRMAIRQQRHVLDLRNALLRIQNKTYGVCIVTGQLIDANRLRLVPHATKSMEGKSLTANKEVSAGGPNNGGDPFSNDEEPPVPKPIGDKVRLSTGKRPTSGGDDWEIGSESMESAEGYSAQKFEDDDD